MCWLVVEAGAFLVVIGHSFLSAPRRKPAALVLSVSAGWSDTFQPDGVALSFQKLKQYLAVQRDAKPLKKAAPQQASGRASFGLKPLVFFTGMRQARDGSKK